MPMPQGIGIIDLMLGFPIADYDKTYDFLRKAARDKESKEDRRFPVEYMFKGVPYDFGKGARPARGHARGDGQVGHRARHDRDRRRDQPARPGGASEALRRLHPGRPQPGHGRRAPHGERAYEQVRHQGGRAASRPASRPQVDINDKRFFPLYAKACELGIAFFVNAGVPGPRVPMHCQHVEHLDEVCWFFPELTLVTYHGCEPWQDLVVKLMLKWPGLHYATSAFAPKHYPKAIIDYANTRGADKVLYAGYFPMGLTLERIMTEMRSVPFRDAVWPKFLRENALRVLKLAG